MRYLLIWMLVFFDPVEFELTVHEGSEIHLSRYSCLKAQKELHALTDAKGLCIPENNSPPTWGTTITRKLHIGTIKNGRRVSEYQRPPVENIDASPGFLRVGRHL